MDDKNSQLEAIASGRTMFVLLVWPEHQAVEAPQWRGLLESTEGERRYFRSLDELMRLVVGWSGWTECPLDSQGEKDHEAGATQ